MPLGIVAAAVIAIETLQYLTRTGTGDSSTSLRKIPRFDLIVVSGYLARSWSAINNESARVVIPQGSAARKLGRDQRCS
jgi:hypothetical protein